MHGTVMVLGADATTYHSTVTTSKHSVTQTFPTLIQLLHAEVMLQLGALRVKQLLPIGHGVPGGTATV
jgi:hypothetical protein